MKSLQEIRKKYDEINSILKKTEDFNTQYKYPYIDPAPFIYPKKENICFLYIMKNNRNGYFKIGKSKNPVYREKTLQSEDPDITLLYKWETKKCVEKSVHKMFSNNRLRGEWFYFTDLEILEVLSYINKLISL